jgi:hypothetical protein
MEYIPKISTVPWIQLSVIIIHQDMYILRGHIALGHYENFLTGFVYRHIQHNYRMTGRTAFDEYITG